MAILRRRPSGDYPDSRTQFTFAVDAIFNF